MTDEERVAAAAAIDAAFSNPDTEEALTRLKNATANLAPAFDALAQRIVAWEEAIGTTSVTAWVKCSGDFDDYHFGWAKVGDKWRLAAHCEDGENNLPLTNAPLAVRLEALSRMKELLSALIGATNNLAGKIKRVISQ